MTSFWNFLLDQKKKNEIDNDHSQINRTLKNNNEGYISENENRTIQKQNVISHEITKNKSALSKFYIF